MSYNLNSSDEFADAIMKMENCIADIHLWMSENKLEFKKSLKELNPNKSPGDSFALVV